MAARGLGGFSKLKWYYQVLTAVAICGLGLGGLWYQFIDPLDAEILTKKNNATELEAQVKKAEDQKKTYEKFKIETVALEARLDGLKKLLPLDQETDQILRTLQAEAVNSQVRITDTSLRPFIDHEVYREWPWNMQMVGTYNNVGAFLDRVRQLPRIVNITGLKLNVRASEGEKAFSESVGASFTATTFIYHEEAPVPAAPAKPAK